MILVLIALAIAAVLAMGFMQAQSTTTHIAANIRGSASARTIAESGLAMAIREVESNPNWRTAHNHGTWTNEVSLGGGTLTLKGEDGTDSDGDGLVEGDASLSDDPLDSATLTATGAFEGATHTVRAIVTAEASTGFTPGLIVSDAISLDSFAKIDSYNSNKGQYGGQNVGAQAVVSTNSILPGKINVRGGASIRGDAYAGPGGLPGTVITTDSAAQITGIRSGLTVAATIPTISLPIAVTTMGDATLTSSYDLLDDYAGGNYRVNNLTITGSSTRLRVLEKCSLTVDGNFVITNGAKLEIASGASLKLYIHRALTVSGGAQLNTSTAAPGSLMLYNLGVDNITVTSGQLAAYIVSPAARLVVDGSAARYYGVYQGLGITGRNSGILSYDWSRQVGSKQFVDFQLYNSNSNAQGNVSGQDGWVVPNAYTSSNARVVTDGTNKSLRLTSLSEATAVYRTFTVTGGQLTTTARWFWKPTSASVNQSAGLMGTDRTGTSWSDYSVRVLMKRDGTFDVTGGVGKPATPIPYNTAGHWVEIRINGIGIAGTFEVFIDGQRLCNATPLLRVPLNNASLSRFVAKADPTGGDSGGQEIDNITFGDMAGTIAGAAGPPTYTATWSEQP